MVLPDAFQSRELRLGIDAFYFKAAARTRGIDAHAITHGQSDHVGEVVLALGIGSLEFGKPPLQTRRRQKHDAGVDFSDLFLTFGSILLFDDRHDAALLAQDATVTGGIAQHGRKNGHAVASSRQQTLNRFGLYERHIAQQHQGVFGFGVKFGQRTLQCVTGSHLRLLQHEAQTFFLRKSALDGFGAATDHHYGARDAFELLDACEHVTEHRRACQRLQHFGQGRAHALALACSENNDVDHESIPKKRRPFEFQLVSGGIGVGNFGIILPSDQQFVACQRKTRRRPEPLTGYRFGKNQRN